MLTETMYDMHGRAVLQSLPAPAPLVATPVDGYRSKLTYVSGFNKTDAVSPVIYDKQQYAMNMVDCSLNVPPVGKSIGAGQYYSSENPKKNDYHAYIPDAGGYPFTFTQYTPDNTGRVLRQSGVGPTHKIGSSHEIQYLYGTPDQEELDRLFGTDVGLANHYFKTAVIDPNDQVSVSYTDMDGHVIATALAGPSAENLDPLTDGATTAYEASMEEYTVDILEKTEDEPIGLNNFASLDGKTLTSTDVFIVPEETEYHFIYSAEGSSYLAECLSNRCFECVYDLTLSLTNDCGVEFLNTATGDAFTHQLGTSPTLGATPSATPCSNATYTSVSGDDLVFTVTLPRGTYTMTKTIMVSEEAINLHASNYIAQLEADNPECFSTIDELLAATEDFEITCEISCDYCQTLGSLDDFLSAEFPNPEDLDNPKPEIGSPEYAFYENIYNDLMDMCAQVCPENVMSPCAAGVNAMLADLAPGGQYAEYKIDADDNYSANDYALSILNLDNNLLDRSIVTTPVDEPEAAAYKYPITYFDGQWHNGYYKDGVRETVDLSIYFALDPLLTGIYDGPLTLSDLDGDGVSESAIGYPEYLTLKYFIQFYQYDWGYGLLLYHPEYYYYAACLNYSACTSEIVPPVEAPMLNLSTFTFDEQMLAYTYDDIMTSVPWKKPYTIDPLFDNTTCTVDGVDYETFVTNYIEDYGYCEMGFAPDVHLNIYQVLYLTMNYPELDFCDAMPSEIDDYADIDDMATLGVINSTESWLYFTILYKAAKTKYLNALSHAYAQNYYSINLSIQNDAYWPPVITTLNDLAVADPWDEVTTNTAYLPYYTRSVELSTKSVRFPDMSWHNGLPPNLAYDDPMLDDLADEVTADVDYAYYTETGNLPMSEDFMVMLNLVTSQAEDAAIDWRTTPVETDDIIGISARLRDALDEYCLGTWDAAMSTVNHANDKLTWSIATGCTPTGACSDNYIQLDHLATPAVNYGWDEELVGFSDIITELDGNFTIIAVFSIDGEYVHLPAHGHSCIPFDQTSYLQTHCDLTSDAAGVWSVMNYLIGINQLNATSYNLDPTLVPEILTTYLLPIDPTSHYIWRHVADGEYSLSNIDNAHTIRLSMTTGDDLSGANFISNFEPDPELIPAGYPIVTTPIDLFTLSQNGGITFKSGYISYTNTAMAGGSYVLHSFPVATCGHDAMLEQPCQEPEHFSAFNLNDLLAELLGNADPIIEDTYIALESPDIYPGWTTHLSTMMGGSDVQDEFMYIQSYTGNTLDIIFKTEIATDTYVDLCHVSLTIADPLAPLSLEDLSANILLVPHAELAEADGIHDFTLECTDGSCTDDEIATIAWGYIDCLTLKACPCPDKNINGSFYYDVVTDVTIEGGVIGVVGDHPITGVHDAESYSIGTTEKTIMLDYQTYLKSGKIDITETAELKLQLFAFGKEALIDTIYADSTADTITVYLRLDGYDAVGSNLRTGIGECSSNPIETPYIPYIDPCLQDQIDLAINNAYAAYEQQIIELTESFKEAYIAQCMGNLSEDFTKSFSSSEYHYTLYY
ncbi:MAG TPA: hypothetical protein PKN40_14480, partial [Chitinophagales bacterium]|nr:hypothetical protein [Chitinophagales bacterium]